MTRTSNAQYSGFMAMHDELISLLCRQQSLLQMLKITAW
jgi:hypothetical protein